jgi:hypothetical protein
MLKAVVRSDNGFFLSNKSQRDAVFDEIILILLGIKKHKNGARAKTQY